MTTQFKVGDHVRWNSEAGHVYPQYGKEALATTLAGQASGYQWLRALGGRRRPSPDSPNTAWRNASFHGYADYMSTVEFALGLDQLLELSDFQSTRQ